MRLEGALLSPSCAQQLLEAGRTRDRHQQARRLPTLACGAGSSNPRRHSPRPPKQSEGLETALASNMPSLAIRIVGALAVLSIGVVGTAIPFAVLRRNDASHRFPPPENSRAGRFSSARVSFTLCRKQARPSRNTLSAPLLLCWAGGLGVLRLIEDRQRHCPDNAKELAWPSRQGRQRRPPPTPVGKSSFGDWWLHPREPIERCGANLVPRTILHRLRFRQRSLRQERAPERTASRTCP